MMRRKDYLYLFLLALLGAYIWMWNTYWMASKADTLPILITLPIFWWLGRPWNFLTVRESFSYGYSFAGILLVFLGMGLDAMVLLAAGWTVLLAGWLRARLGPVRGRAIRPLFVLPVLAFPWILSEANIVGWWFRFSGAWTVEKLFGLIGSTVDRTGTSLVVRDIELQIDAACAGLNELQSMLIAGVAIGYWHLGRHLRYGAALAVTVIVAWFANTARIALLAFAGLWVTPEFAMGMFHTIGGLAVLCLMFTGCWGVFSYWNGAR